MRLIDVGTYRLSIATAIAVIALGGLVAVADRQGEDQPEHFWPGNLVLSRSVYNNDPANIAVGTIVPPHCASTTAGCGKNDQATNDGSLPLVWNNDLVDGSFGITSAIFLDQLTPSGAFINTLQVPNSTQPGVSSRDDQLVTSFSSKSELALNLSTDRRRLSFMGYVAPVGAIDVSNSNTPLVVDPTNPVGENAYRAVADVDRHGRFRFTLTNAYSGNNGRAAVLNDTPGGPPVFYTAGNAGNGGNPQPDGIIIGAGAQFLTREHQPEAGQSPLLPTPVGSFDITELGLPHDKIGKDTNFRGLTIFDDVIYYSKGSGSNGINTVYFVDTTGLACPRSGATPGVGVPGRGAALPTAPLAYDMSHAGLQANGVAPTNMCILAGFPTLLASSATGVADPFGLWFANDHTLYVADEGDGTVGTTPATFYDHAAAQSAAGLQKWVLNTTTHTWALAYTLQLGLELGAPYTVRGYPTGNNPGTGLPWEPATDGLRNITGRVNADGTATIWAITSTVSGNGDQGADPNRLVVITDRLAASTAGRASFTTLRTARYGEVLRGVSFTPGTGVGSCADRHDLDSACR